MFKESASYFKDRFFLCGDVEFCALKEERSTICNFAKYLGYEKFDRFLEKLQKKEQLLYWMEQEIKSFNDTSRSILPIDRDNILALWGDSLC